MNRDKLVTSYLQAGYPKDYILGQETLAWKHVKNGTRPNGESSDMLVAFYDAASPEAIARGIRERELATKPDKNGFTYFSRQFSGTCCHREMKWIEDENLLLCCTCGAVSHRE